MNSQTVTIGGMAKHRNGEGGPKKKPGRPTAGGRKPAYVLHCRIEPVLGKALERYIDATRPTPTLTSAVELALEQLLQAAGFWPPPEEES